MATRYLKAAGGNYNAAATWSATGSGGADNAGVPTAADDVILENGSGQLTITANAVCRSFNCTSGTGDYGGTLTHNSGQSLTIGDGTSGAGNVALKFSTGMTYTKGSTTTSSLIFASTSGTTQKITFNGQQPANIQFTQTGSWQFQDGYTANATTLTHTKGTFDLNNQTINIGTFASNNSNTRTLTLGTGTINLATGGGSAGWNFATAGGLTVTSNTATINFSAASPNLSINGQDFNGAAFNFTAFTATATMTMAGNPTLDNVNFTCPANTTGVISVTGDFTIRAGATLTVAGNSVINRPLFRSSVFGTPRTITNNGTNTWSNVDIQDITGAGSASWNFASISGGSGDCGGNSGITFTTPVTRYKVATGNWSAAASWGTISGGSGGATAPLPQDTAIMDSGTPTGTHTVDKARICANFQGSAKTLTASTNAEIFGSITLSGTFAFAGNNQWSLKGRGANTITSGGITFPMALTCDCATGSYTLQDSLTDSRSATNLTVTTGTFDANGFNMTFTSATNNSVLVQLTGVLNMGSGIWDFQHTAAGIVFWQVTGGTVNASSSTIKLSTASTNTRTFQGGGATYNILQYTVAGSTGKLAINDSNTFAKISFKDATNARTIQFDASSTTTFSTAAGMDIVGTSGKLMSIISATAGTKCTFACSSGLVATDYVSITDNDASGNLPFYAGTNSTLSNTTGWQAYAAPQPTMRPLLGVG